MGPGNGDACLFHTQPNARKNWIVRKFLASAHVTREEIFQASSRHQLAGFLEISGRVVAILFIELVIEITHDVIERLRVIRAPSNLQIEQKAQQLAFVVIRDLRVH